MEELTKLIQTEKQHISEDKRDEWERLTLRYSKLCLERGDSIEKISNFIKS